jgi:hypothetical protein
MTANENRPYSKFLASCLRIILILVSDFKDVLSTLIRLKSVERGGHTIRKYGAYLLNDFNFPSTHQLPIDASTFCTVISISEAKTQDQDPMQRSSMTLLYDTKL